MPFSKNYGIIAFGLALFFSFLFTALYAQQKEEKVRLSPKASLSQTVGFTEVTISYGRPGVKGRKIWGSLVPYDKVWRAGANEATKFTFSTDVMIEGKKLPAGSYSFFIIPSKDNWTIIFNKVADQWGAFEYNEAEDALRITVKPEKSDFTEWLKYDITKTSDSGATINLEWEKLRVPFKIEVKI
ncbi:MAG TPA: DUF2911 domain-containing protein [Ignavibacteriaceae bacterium]|nr:DUF2911 domain-containing protein [Ignavibacteriaceae bacterium]